MSEVNWNKLEEEGRIDESSTVAQIISEVRREMTDARIAKCVTSSKTEMEGRPLLDVLREE